MPQLEESDRRSTASDITRNPHRLGTVSFGDRLIDHPKKRLAMRYRIVPDHDEIHSLRILHSSQKWPPE